VLEYATLVVADRHTAGATRLIPPWWGCVEVTAAADGLRLDQRSPARPNPAVDPYSLAQLLWRDEALEELALRGLDQGVRSKPRARLWQRLASELPLSTLQVVVTARLRSRAGWRPALRPSVDDAACQT
jgi:hypothetical protein